MPHDSLVKRVFGKRRHAAGLLKAVLPAEIVDAVAWRTLKLENRSFVSRALRGRHIDLLFSAKLHGEPIYFYYLIEQQRKVEKLMIVRMGAYAFRAWEHLVGEEPTRETIPLVVPILIHHSDTGWTAATRFQDVVAVPGALRAALAPYTPSFEMAVVDVSPGQATRIAEQMLTALGKVVLWCLSVAGDDARLANEIGRMAQAFQAMRAARDGVDAFHTILSCLLATHRRMSAPEIVRLLGTTASEEQKMDLLDELDVFRDEGRHEASTKMLLALLKARFGRVPAEAKARILAAKEAQLERWSIRVLTAPTLEAVLDEKPKKAAHARRRAAPR
jgi:hypothetical protein